MEFKDYDQLIKQWAQERGLLDDPIVYAQMRKVFEEARELDRAMYSNDDKGIVDGIGDVLVTLIVLGWQINSEAVAKGWPSVNDVYFLEAIYDRKRDNIKELTKDLFDAIRDLDHVLRRDYPYARQLRIAYGVVLAIAKFYQLKPLYCLDYAYNEIKDRTGKLVDGSFFKDE